MPDPLSFKTTTVKRDHKNAAYRTRDILRRPRQTVFGCSTAENGKVTMQKVHTIDQNSKIPPQYNVSYEPRRDDEDIWTELHEHLYSPSE